MPNEKRALEVGGALTIAFLVAGLGIAYGQGGPGDPGQFPCDPMESPPTHTAAAGPGGWPAQSYSEVDLMCAPERYPHVTQTCFWCIEGKGEFSTNGTTNWYGLQFTDFGTSDPCGPTPKTVVLVDNYNGPTTPLPAGGYRHTFNVFRGPCPASGAPVVSDSITFIRP